MKIPSTSTERQRRSQNLAPVLVIISGNSLVFPRKIITSTGFYRCCGAGASAPVVVKNQSPIVSFVLLRLLLASWVVSAGRLRGCGSRSYASGGWSRGPDGQHLCRGAPGHPCHAPCAIRTHVFGPISRALSGAIQTGIGDLPSVVFCEELHRNLPSRLSHPEAENCLGDALPFESKLLPAVLLFLRLYFPQITVSTLVARFARIVRIDSRESTDSRESEIRVIRANRPDAL